MKSCYGYFWYQHNQIIGNIRPLFSIYELRSIAGQYLAPFVLKLLSILSLSHTHTHTHSLCLLHLIWILNAFKHEFKLQAVFYIWCLLKLNFSREQLAEVRECALHRPAQYKPVFQNKPVFKNKCSYDEHKRLWKSFFEFVFIYYYCKYFKRCCIYWTVCLSYSYRKCLSRVQYTEHNAYYHLSNLIIPKESSLETKSGGLQSKNHDETCSNIIWNVKYPSPIVYMIEQNLMTGSTRRPQKTSKEFHLDY